MFLPPTFYKTFYRFKGTAMKEKKIKIGLIGLGQRGAGYCEGGNWGAIMGNILKNEDVELLVICDKRQERIQGALNYIEKEGYEKPLAVDDYNKVIEIKPDAIIVATSWDNHVVVALAAMRANVPVAIEVGGTHSINDCWALVDCYEETKTPFMFLENCCYAKDELLATSLVRNGLLGEIVYCSGLYGHDLREEIVGGIDTHHYRLNEYQHYNCENYPTHELGPIAKILNINRGNRFVRVVSMSSKAVGLKNYINKTEKYANRMKDYSFAQGDIVTTMIECENGEVISLKLDTTLPRLYDRGLTVCGTDGQYCQTTQSVVLDDGTFNHERDEIKKSFFSQDNYDKYLPDDWLNITEEQKKAGHGGMDFIMLKHFFHAVKNKQEMPIDVYDAVSWMCITALSEQSIAGGSIPVECPDFTRGKYRDRLPLDVMKMPLRETEF